MPATLSSQIAFVISSVVFYSVKICCISIFRRHQSRIAPCNVLPRLHDLFAASLNTSYPSCSAPIYTVAQCADASATANFHAMMRYFHDVFAVN